MWVLPSLLDFCTVTLARLKRRHCHVLSGGRDPVQDVRWPEGIVRERRFVRELFIHLHFQLAVLSLKAMIPLNLQRHCHSVRDWILGASPNLGCTELASHATAEGFLGARLSLVDSMASWPWICVKQMCPWHLLCWAAGIRFA